VSFVAATFNVPSNKPSLDAALEGLVRLNVAQRRAGVPALYSSGVRYRRDKGETWDSAQICCRRGWGDCEDLAAWRAADLRLRGIPARAVVQRSKTPGVSWHAVVQLPNGRIEDPSRRLGM